MNTDNVAYIIQGSKILFTINGKCVPVDKESHLNYDKILIALKEDRLEDAVKLTDVSSEIESFFNGKISIRAGQVIFDGELLHTSLTTRLLEMYRKSMPLTALLNFLNNLMENPSKTAVSELYGFLENNKLPLTQDGHFLAYKMVKKDSEGHFRDLHTGTVLNDVGCRVKMKRYNVDDNRNNTCSFGLHFCSKEYFGVMGYTNIVILKINPKDVVSIPSDYNNSKGRCCEYLVVDEFTQEDTTKDAFDLPVYSVQTLVTQDVNLGAE